MSDISLDSQVELYDSDLVKIRKIFHELDYKYSTLRDTKENLKSLVHEAEDKFRNIGFEITVSMSKKIAWAMGVAPKNEMPSLITFSIDRRIQEHEFDYEQMAWEAKKDLIPDEVASNFLKKGGTENQQTVVEATVEAPEKQD